MQLSFLYATTALAAVWASPVPEPANQAVATQPLSERAGVPYASDIPFGGLGGDSFTDLPTLEAFDVAPTIKLAVILAGNRINHVKLSGFSGVPSVEYNAPHGHDANSLTNPTNTADVHLDLADGEWVNFVMLKNLGGRVGSSAEENLVFMRLETNFGNYVEAGSKTQYLHTVNFTAPAGFRQVVGFLGKDGDRVDSIAPIWA